MTARAPRQTPAALIAEGRRLLAESRPSWRWAPALGYALDALQERLSEGERGEMERRRGAEDVGGPDHRPGLSSSDAAPLADQRGTTSPGADPQGVLFAEGG